MKMVSECGFSDDMRTYGYFRGNVGDVVEEGVVGSVVEVVHLHVQGD